MKITDREGFPRPVIHVEGGRLWIKAEVLAFKEGTYDPKTGAKENELRPLYMSRKEVMEATGLSPWQLKYASAKHKPPEPAIRRERVWLWRPEDVEAWVKEHNQ
jgi:predicted DNA-binding transcriptional regulator AlpA